MENASKALLMAGGVLIGIMVISFMVLVLRKAGKMSAQYDNQIANNELTKFNGQFEIYDKNDNNFFDVITVANLAYDINKKNGYDKQNSVTVEVKAGSETYYILPNSNLPKDHFLKNNQNIYIYIYNSQDANQSLIEKFGARKQNDSTQYQYQFDCTKIMYSQTTGKVEEIKFEAKENN